MAGRHLKLGDRVMVTETGHGQMWTGFGIIIAWAPEKITVDFYEPKKTTTEYPGFTSQTIACDFTVASRTAPFTKEYEWLERQRCYGCPLQRFTADFSTWAKVEPYVPGATAHVQNFH